MVDLLETGCLFLRRLDDRRNVRIDIADLNDDFLQRLAGLPDQIHAVPDQLTGGRDHRLDLIGSMWRALCQFAHFLRNHRKALARLAGTDRLDAGIERQKIRLERDIVDDADDAADLTGRLLDWIHGGNGIAHHGARLFSALLGFGDQPSASSARRLESLTVVVISSSAAAVSSTDAACCSVRLENASDGHNFVEYCTG